MKSWAILPLLVLALGCSKPEVKEILGKSRDATFALKSYKATCVSTITYDEHPQKMYEVSTLTAEKPNRMRYDSWRMFNPPDNPASFTTTAPPDLTFACAGKIRYEQFGDHYRTDNKTSPEYMHTMLEPWGGFYHSGNSPASSLDARNGEDTVETKYDGVEDVDGVACDKVAYHAIGKYMDSKVERKGTYYIAQSDHLVRRQVDHISFDDKPGHTRDSKIYAIQTNTPVQASVYTYIPPAGVKRETGREQRPALLANGSKAPDFSATDADGKTVKLSDLKGKVVVLDFWASWCGPCIASMPHTQNVAKTLSDSGVPVVVFAVDDGEPKDAFQDWVSTKRKTYPNLQFAWADPTAGTSSKLYKVSGIPTQYVIDKKGIVRASFVGFGGETDDLANAIKAANVK